MIENKNWEKNKTQLIIGADEVGRGSLAGPIVGAAVKLKFLDIDLLSDVRDSKKLSPKKREAIVERITNSDIEFSISECSNTYIDKNGISEANKKVLKESVQSIYTNKEKVYIDHFNLNEFSAISLIRGEDHSYAIALASIIAKVHRDKIMTKFSSVYPNYLFEKNKGYGTREHLDMLQKYGPCIIHRTSFNLGPKLQQQK